MVKFRCYRLAKDGTPRIGDKDIENYAERILKEYKPLALKEPTKIKPVHFLENYLNVTIEYAYIYDPNGVGRIAGEAIFNDDEEVEIFDVEKLKRVIRKYAANTVLIDNTIMKEGKEGFADFTHLHEGGHIFLHASVFKRTQGTLFNINTDNRPRAARCLRTCIESDSRRKLVTQEDFREHQANTFAAAIAMPPTIFIPTAKKIIFDCGYSDGVCVVPGPDDVIDWYDAIDGRDHEVIDQLMELFTGSRSAIRVQLKKHNLMVTEEEYEKRGLQKKLFF